MTGPVSPVKAAARQSNFFSFCRIHIYSIKPNTPPNQWTAYTPHDVTDPITNSFIYLFARRHAFQPKSGPPGGPLGSPSGSPGGPPYELWVLLYADESGNLSGVTGQEAVDAASGAALDHTDEHSVPLKDADIEQGLTLSGKTLSVPDVVAGEPVEVYAVASPVAFHLRTLQSFENERPPYIQPFDASQLQAGKHGWVWPVTDHVAVIDPLRIIYEHNCNKVGHFLKDEELQRKVVLWQLLETFEKNGTKLNPNLDPEYKDFKKVHYDDLLEPLVRKREESAQAVSRWMKTDGFTAVARSYFDGSITGDPYKTVEGLLKPICEFLARCNESELGKVVLRQSFPDGSPLKNAVDRLVQDYVLPTQGVSEKTFISYGKNFRFAIAAWASYLTWLHEGNLAMVRELNKLAHERRHPWIPTTDVIEKFYDEIPTKIDSALKNTVTGWAAFKFKKLLENILNDVKAGGPARTISISITTHQVEVMTHGSPTKVEVLDAQYGISTKTVTLSDGRTISLANLKKVLDIANVALSALAFTESLAQRKILKSVANAAYLTANVLNTGNAVVNAFLARVTGRDLFKGTMGVYGVSVAAGFLTAAAAAVDAVISFGEGDVDAAAAYVVAGVASLFSLGTYVALGAGVLTAAGAAPILFVCTIVGTIAFITAGLVTDSDYEKLIKHSVFGSHRLQLTDWAPAWAQDGGTRDYTQFTSDLAGLNRQISAACALMFDFAVQPGAGGITIKCGSYGEQSVFDVSYTIAVHRVTKIGPHGRIYGADFVKNWSVQFRVVPSSRTVIHQGGEKATLNITGSGDLRMSITPNDAAVDDAINKRGASVGAFVVWSLRTETTLDVFGTHTVVLPASMGITGATHVINNSYASVSMLETLENHRP